ncbi:NAD(P)H-dependent oxidoreductase [Vagococcus silagei]|uniref:NAD(P)H-dependent oxidoreductase n=1 Tax=Vagococcus silagei TaxID=2508885 RepID=UPI001EF4B4F0|nr:NAD(P)H-dependent oxidoreductase [Vagococcus silagei]
MIILGNHALLKKLVAGLEADKKDYQVIDLYKDKFNPVMQTAELARYQSGTTTDPIVQKYINCIKETDQLILIFPIWWYSCPAGLKGFFDKVLLNNVAFYDDGEGVKPMLNVKNTVIFSTTEQTTEGIYSHAHDCFRNQIATTLADVGCQSIQWHNLGQISSLTQEERVQFLTESYSKIK